MVELRLFRPVEHETHAATVEEGRAAGSKQQRQTEDIPVKCCGTVQIVYVIAICPSRARTVRRAGLGLRHWRHPVSEPDGGDELPLNANGRRRRLDAALADYLSCGAA